MLVFFTIKLLVVPILSCLALKQFIGGGDLLGICIVMDGNAGSEAWWLCWHSNTAGTTRCCPEA